MSPLALLAIAALSTVAIELPANTPAETGARVVDSCNAALGETRCSAAVRGTQGATFVAVVRFEDDAVEIRLLRNGATGEPGEAREVDRRSVAFAETDAPSDRSIAAGLMVAALAAGQPAPAPPEPLPRPVAAVPPPDTAPQPAPPPPTHVGLDLGVELGPGLASENPRWGGGLWLWWMAHAPRVGLRAGASYLTASKPVDLAWATASLGLVSRLTRWSSAASFVVFADALVQRASASARRDDTEDSAGVARWGGRIGSRVGLDLGLGVQPWFGWELTLLRPAFEVRLGQEAIGSTGPLSFGVSIGATLAPYL